MGIINVLVEAYDGSIHTILTSGLIMVIVTLVMGYAFPDLTAGQICHIISKGVTAAIILVVFLSHIYESK